jgi:GT2 family glycosyltransferase
MEEIDLCWRLQAEGYRIFCCPSSVVYHLGGGSLPKGNPRKVFLNFRNNLIMLAKNLPLPLALLILPLRIALDLLAACKHVVSGEKDYFKPILQAQGAFFQWLVSDKSKFLFPKHKSLPRNGFYRGSIVWKHFILGMRSFEEIVR